MIIRIKYANLTQTIKTKVTRSNFIRCSFVIGIVHAISVKDTFQKYLNGDTHLII